MEPLAVLTRRADGGFTLSPIPDTVAGRHWLAEGGRTPWTNWPIVRDWGQAGPVGSGVDDKVEPGRPEVRGFWARLGRRQMTKGRGL